MRPLILLSLLFVQSFLLAQEEESEVLKFAVVEQVPVAPGCDSLGDASQQSYRACLNSYVIQHIARNFQYPEIARKQKVGARILVKFVIEKDGRVDQVDVVNSARLKYSEESRKKQKAAKALDAEAARVIGTLHFDQPAIQRGKPVRMSFTVPINTRL